MTDELPLTEVPAGGGTTAEALLVVPEAAGPHPAVIMYMDAFGVRPELWRKAREFAEAGFVVLAPNLFHREAKAQDIAPAEPLLTPEARSAYFDKVRPLMAKFTADLGRADTAAYLQYLQSLPIVAAGPMGVIGYCMGVRHAMRAAGDHPQDVAAVAGFHPGGLVTDDPDSPHLSIATARAEFLIGVAENDASMTPEQVQTLAAEFDRAGLTADLSIWPDTVHGFTMADTASYRAAGSERAASQSIALFTRTLTSR